MYRFGTQSGLNVGDTYNYQVIATQAENLTLTYALIDAPAGMAMDAQHLISWKAKAVTGGKVAFKIKVTDSAKAEAVQSVSIIVCTAPDEWHGEMGHCM